MPPDSLTPAVPPLSEALDRAAALLRARYGAADAPAVPRWNDVLDSLLAHRSVRAFLPTPLPEGALDLLLAAAQSAASSSNLQAWSVVAVQDPARKARLAALAGGQAHIEQAPLFLVWLADLDRLARIATAEGSEIEGIAYLELLVVGIVDAALAAQNAVVALESLDLGAVYIGAIRNNTEAVAAELGLPPRVLPVVGLSIGHPDPAAAGAVKPRLAPSAVLHHETYRQDGQDEAVARYNDVLAGFQREQGLPEERWSRKVAERVRTPTVLAGRHRLRQALGTLGFELR
ncbi:NADPH-dependent oxidoreductase [Rhodovastum atsumiense]|uniref:NADPH-dependent oxidoreductase n=1 Tax=Rhodovastum atsumiense TaxID=504468 RepID=A0A5M6IP29_9PROT|nr:nitroreductase family protein [Rhodovastum atsumiense]KAA5610016.1 NADPH-dependent oxidoreductase [Rhodovastum atsumiense]CAH2603000.1 NADPH-dependent oxidoreductase [Rhodovastum atsumiense]